MSARIIKVFKDLRGCAAGYDDAEPLTPDAARELARRLVVCADQTDVAVARDKGKRK